MVAEQVVVKWGPPVCKNSCLWDFWSSSYLLCCTSAYMKIQSSLEFQWLKRYNIFHNMLNFICSVPQHQPWKFGLQIIRILVGLLVLNFGQSIPFHVYEILFFHFVSQITSSNLWHTQTKWEGIMHWTVIIKRAKRSS